MGPGAVRRLVADVLAGLEAAHRRGVIHRDIKPANIFYDARGTGKIGDFGVAHLLDLGQTQTGGLIGTLAYMSPEQLMADTIDARSDIFSLGVLIYEMATGKRPFDGPNPAVILVSLLNSPVPAIGGGSADLDRIIARATARKPGGRYQRVTDLLSDLRALMTGMAIATPPITRLPAIAVLPFANLTSNADQEYFCDGMAEELISALSRVKGLAVVSRTSAFQFKGTAVDIREIGERLGVQTVLEGSVRKAGNRLRISAQLVNVADGYHVWSERFDRNIDDVFLIQDEIARSIAESLRVTLTRPATGMMVKPATSNLEAYHLYLRGRFLLNRFADLFGSLTAARQCFEDAIALDPMYSAAYAGLAETCTALGYTTFLPAPEASRAAFEAAEHAVTLDPSLPEGHTALGWTKTLFAMDMRTAERDFQRALEISPGYAPAHGYFALLLCGFGRFDEALDHAAQARHHDPLWMMMPFIMSQVLICARRFEQAERQMRELLAIDPNIDGCYWYLSSALAGQGRLDEAIEVQEKGVTLVRRAPFFVALLAIWYSRRGRAAEAEGLLEELTAGGRCTPVWLAMVCGALGRQDAAFEYLELAIAQHDDQVSFMAVDHRFDSLRGDPRFDAALRRLGLPVLAR
jgi:TolB-like protein/Tfp pilus assembly protein PilF